MGAWGTKAWENDAALNWYDQVMEQANLVGLIDETLASDVRENCEEIRAAASILWMLNEPEIWAAGIYQQFVNRAVTQYKEILSSGVYQNESMLYEVDRELESWN